MTDHQNSETHFDLPIILSPGGTSIQRRRRSSNTLVVGTTDGVWVLECDESREWRLRNKGLEGTFVSSLTCLSSGVLVAGTHGFGLARSVDGGRTWLWANAGITTIDIWTVKAEQIAGKEVLFAGTMPAHLFRSDDAGLSWRELREMNSVATSDKWAFPPPPHYAHVKDITVHQNEQLLVGIEVGALLRSDNEGCSFVELPLDADIAEVDIHRILCHPARPDRIIAVTGWGLKMSEDAGATWFKVELPDINYPDPMVFHPDRPDLLFIAGACGYPPNWYAINRAKPRVARSNDGGKTWERLLGGLPDGQRAVFGAMSLDAHDEGFAVYIGDTDGQIFESLDGGDTWHVIFETAGLSKGEQYRGLIKHRPPMMLVDALSISGAGAKRFAEATA